MSKNVILICDSNKTFVRGFSMFFATSDTEEIIIIDSLEDIDKWQYNYLLIDVDLKSKLEYPDQRVFYLVDGEDQNVPTHISRYLNAKQVLNHLNEAMVAYSNQPLSIMLFSMAGGTGKSLFATGLCNAIENLGKHTLYLSYSLCNDTLHKDIDLSLLIYYLHHKQEVPESVLRSMRETLARPTSRINAFMNTPEDRAFLNTDVIIALTELLKQIAGDRTLLLELPWGSGDELKAVAGQTHYNLLFTDNRHEADSREKWSTYYKKEFGNEEGLITIQNRGKQAIGETDAYVIPNFDEQYRTRGVEEWISKYLLTQWMK